MATAKAFDDAVGRVNLLKIRKPGISVGCHIVLLDGSVGVMVTGALDQNYFANIARNLPEGTWEFVCHPGYNEADLDQVRTRLRKSREQELAPAGFSRIEGRAAAMWYRSD